MLRPSQRMDVYVLSMRLRSSKSSTDYLSLLQLIVSVNFRLVDSYASYFGALTCVAWSPDGRFILVSAHPYMATRFQLGYPIDGRPGRFGDDYLSVGTTCNSTLPRAFFVRLGNLL
jgi:hypothetical protein